MAAEAALALYQHWRLTHLVYVLLPVYCISIAYNTIERVPNWTTANWRRRQLPRLALETAVYGWRASHFCARLICARLVLIVGACFASFHERAVVSGLLSVMSAAPVFLKFNERKW